MHINKYNSSVVSFRASIIHNTITCTFALVQYVRYAYYHQCTCVPTRVYAYYEQSIILIWIQYVRADMMHHTRARIIVCVLHT